jgi:hypothetical protein
MNSYNMRRSRTRKAPNDSSGSEASHWSYSLSEAQASKLLDQADGLHSQTEQGVKLHLSGMESGVLNWIREYGKGRPKQIALGLGFKPPSVRRTLQQLRDKGLIKSDSDTYELLNRSQMDLDIRQPPQVQESTTTCERSPQGNLDTPADPQSSTERALEDLRQHPAMRDVGKERGKASTIPRVDGVSTLKVGPTLLRNHSYDKHRIVEAFQLFLYRVLPSILLAFQHCDHGKYRDNSTRDRCNQVRHWEAKE